VHVISRFILGGLIAALGVAFPVVRNEMVVKPQLDAGFHLMYELKFESARIQIDAYEQAQPADPLGQSAEAASYLFEELNQKGMLTSAFFCSDDLLLGGVKGPPTKLNEAFRTANQRARKMAETQLVTNPHDPDALLAITLTDGMEADFEALIEKRQLASLGPMRRAQNEADRLLAVAPENGDTYLVLGIPNYIIGCMPSYKRFLLWFGGVHGDRLRGMEQLQVAATRGHYLRPLAKIMLALAAEREQQFERARGLFADLSREFPENPLFAQELALLQKN
jgi:hypothetical protein